jgi:hypothetical protein
MAQLPRSVALLLYALALGAGYLAYRKLAASEGIYALLIAVLVAVGVLFVGAFIMALVLRPARAVVILGGLWALDHFVLHGAGWGFLMDSAFPWASGMVSFLLLNPA